METLNGAEHDHSFEFFATLNLADATNASRLETDEMALAAFSAGPVDKDAVIEELQVTKLGHIEQILNLRKECDSLQQQLRESKMTRPHEDMKARYK